MVIPWKVNDRGTATGTTDGLPLTVGLELLAGCNTGAEVDELLGVPAILFAEAQPARPAQATSMPAKSRNLPLNVITT
jgi:hypothetical protein